MIYRVLLAAGILSSSKADSQGNYQKYMDQYAGGQKNQDASSQSSSGDYQKYMKEYAGGGSQGGNYQQYMKKYAGGNSGNYQQYMGKYAGGSQGGNYQQYYHKYMEKYGGGGSHNSAAGAMNLLEAPKSASTGKSKASSEGDYSQYMKQYAPAQYQKYMKTAGNYQHYANYKSYMKRYGNKSNDKMYGGKDDIPSAESAHNKTELKAWRAESKQSVKWYVPKDYIKDTDRKIDHEYAQRLHEMKHPTTEAPMAEAPADSLSAEQTATTTGYNPFVVEKAVEDTDATDLEEMKQKSFENTEHRKAETAQSSSQSFLAQSDDVKPSPATALLVMGPALLVVVGVAFACWVLFAKRTNQAIELPQSLLG